MGSQLPYRLDNPIHILLVEDNPADAELISHYLKSASSPSISLKHTTSLSKTVQLLGQNQFDVVLLDLFLPDSDGFVTFITLLDRFPEQLFIVITGLSDIDKGVWAAKMGAQDFLLKEEIDSKSLVRSILYAIERHRLQQEVRAFTRDLELAHKRMVEAQHLAQIGSWEYRPEEELMYWSDELYKILGTTAGEQVPTMAALLSFFSPDDQDTVMQGINTLLSRPETLSHTFLLTGEQPVNITWYMASFEGVVKNDRRIIGVVQLSQTTS